MLISPDPATQYDHNFSSLDLSQDAAFRQSRGLPLRLSEIALKDLVKDPEHLAWNEFWMRSTVSQDPNLDPEPDSHPWDIKGFTRKAHTLWEPWPNAKARPGRRPANLDDLKSLRLGDGPLYCTRHSPLLWEGGLTGDPELRQHGRIRVGMAPFQAQRIAWIFHYGAPPPRALSVTWLESCTQPGKCLHVQCLTVAFRDNLRERPDQAEFDQAWLYQRFVECSQNERRLLRWGLVGTAAAAYDLFTNWREFPAPCDLSRAVSPSDGFHSVWQRKSCPFCFTPWSPWPDAPAFGCPGCGRSHRQIREEMKD